MSHTYEDLKKKTVTELRDIAAGLGEAPEVKGYSQLNKEHLLVAICKAMKIETHAHHEVIGIDKTALKARIKTLKLKRNQAQQAHDRAQLKLFRRKIHQMKRKIHKATV